MSIVENEGFKFTLDGKEYRVFHHRKSVKADDGTKPNAHFFWVQPSNIAIEPPISTDVTFWQQRFNQHAIKHDQKTRDKRSQNAKDTKVSSDHPSEQRPVRLLHKMA